MNKPPFFSDVILSWYGKFRRELPWRETKNPYAIWLSEIILQQTRIEQGMAYYLKFIEAYPTVEVLAMASEDDVLKKWQGLGYYSRARNLHQTAKIIVAKYQGQFPPSYKYLLKLKGIGEYTAAAIASIAFNLPHASVDGNVYRVLSRIYGIDSPIDTSLGKRTFSLLANQLMDKQTPGEFNQAVMEFGAIHCTPKRPDCENCPFNNVCIAKAKGTINFFPVKNGKIKIRKRYFNYLLIFHGEFTYLKKRLNKDIWENLYEFPLIETTEKENPIQILLQNQSFLSKLTEIQINGSSQWKKQVLSHQHIFYRFIYLNIDYKNKITPPLIKVNKKDIFNFAVPKPIEKELEANNWF